MGPPSSRRLPRRAPWLALGSALLIAAAPFVACPRIERWRGEREAEEALRALRSCLGGDTGDVALRARVIGADVGESRWPADCAQHALQAEVALARAHRASARCDERCCVRDDACAALAHRRHLLAKLREQLRRRRFEDGVAEALLGRGPAEGGAPEPRLPPPPGPALVGYAQEGSALVETQAGPTLLLHRRGKRADWCALDLTAAGARCQPLAPAIPVADELLIVDGAPAAPPHFLAREAEIAPERWGLYRADGERVVAVEGRSPLGAAPDAVLVEDDDGFALLGPNGAERVESEAVPLLQGDVVFRVERGELIGGAIRASLPDLDRQTLTLKGCLAETPVVLAMVDDGTSEVHAALAFPGGGPARSVSPAVRWFGFTCDDGEASLTWIEELRAESDGQGEAVRGDYGVHRIRCRAEGCRTEREVLALERARRASRYLVASTGEEVTLVWRSAAGDVRYRRAPVGRLAASPTHLVFDDGAGGIDWEASAELLALRDAAVLLVSAPEATHAFLLGAEGAVPLRGNR